MTAPENNSGQAEMEAWVENKTPPTRKAETPPSQKTLSVLLDEIERSPVVTHRTKIKLVKALHRATAFIQGLPSFNAADASWLRDNALKYITALLTSSSDSQTKSCSPSSTASGAEKTGEILREQLHLCAVAAGCEDDELLGRITELRDLLELKEASSNHAQAVLQKARRWEYGKYDPAQGEWVICWEDDGAFITTCWREETARRVVAAHNGVSQPNAAGALEKDSGNEALLPFTQGNVATQITFRPDPDILREIGQREEWKLIKALGTDHWNFTDQFGELQLGLTEAQAIRLKDAHISSVGRAIRNVVEAPSVSDRGGSHAVRASSKEDKSGYGEVHDESRPRIHNLKMLRAISAVVMEHSGNEQLAENVRKYLSACAPLPSPSDVKEKE
jgi:hypothetical protein